MKHTPAWTCLALLFSLRVLSQSDVPTFKAAVRNTFIWGEDAPAGAISSAIKDPMTGAEILKLKYNDVEVSSRMVFEKLRPEDVVELIAYSATIINNTEKELPVEQGGITVDGHFVTPLLSVDSQVTDVKKASQERTDVADVRKMGCFSNDNLPNGSSFRPQQLSSAVIVRPRSSSTVSGVIRDPRHYPLLCSVDGCFPKGTIRYSIRVGSHEYIFSWSGRSLANCGK